MKNNKRIIIGGEKVFPLSLFFSRSKNDLFSDYQKDFKRFFINYTFGGYHSLLAIIDDLKINREEAVLLPSYLCETILMPFQERGIKYVFYRIDRNLTPDFDHINELLEDRVRAILFIDYMGKSQIDKVMPHRERMVVKGIKIIQDCVQAIHISPENTYGDYAFNSFRKTTPFEGSLLLSKTRMHINYAKGLNVKFIVNKRIGQILRYFYLRYNIFKPDWFLFFIEKADRFYHVPRIYKLPKTNHYLIRKLDFSEIWGRNLIYYKVLLNNFQRLTPERFQNPDFQPFGFFMLIEKRNLVRATLHENGILCPVHWPLPDGIGKDLLRESHDIYAKQITIPLMDLNEEKMKHILNTLNMIFKSDKGCCNET